MSRVVVPHPGRETEWGYEAAPPWVFNIDNGFASDCECNCGDGVRDNSVFRASVVKIDKYYSFSQVGQNGGMPR